MGEAELAGEVSGSTIELRAERIAHLFDALDPFPFPQRDLSKTAEDYIVGWARELSTHHPIRIVLHLPPEEAASPIAPILHEAFNTYFSYRANRTDLDIRDLFRVGRISLAIGLSVLATCVIAGQLLAYQLGEGYVSRFFNEGLIILGWVANWRPMEIFLYRWWPVMRQRNLYRRLAAAQIELRPR